MTFQTRGALKTESGVRFAYSVRAAEEDEEVESVVVWNRDGSVSQYALETATAQSELLPYVNAIVFCDHGDRGHIQTLMNLSPFFLFLEGSALTVRSLFSCERRRGSPSTSSSHVRRRLPTG